MSYQLSTYYNLAGYYLNSIIKIKDLERKKVEEGELLWFGLRAYIHIKKFLETTSFMGIT